MTPEQQRIAIAEFCGWKWDGRFTVLDPNGKRLCSRDGEEGLTWKQACLQKKIPDYLNDLNAMHEAWLKLPPSEKERFESELYSIVIGQGEYSRNDDAGWITNATAAQRAEAFIKTLNLWK